MKVKLFGTLLICLLINVQLYGQKLYIWCPSETNLIERNNALSNQQIDIIIFDGRVISEKSKVECSSNDFINKLFNDIKKVYPSAIVNLKGKEEYYSNPKNDIITIKIGISAFHSAFGLEVNTGIGVMGGNLSYNIFPSGKWNAVTNYYVKVYDERNNTSTKFEKEILKVASKSNTGGYGSAKKILFQTYNEAIQDLLFFLDNSLMK